MWLVLNGYYLWSNTGLSLGNILNIMLSYQISLTKKQLNSSQFFRNFEKDSKKVILLQKHIS